MHRKLTLFIIACCWLAGCRPKPEEWLKKAQQSLQLENSEQALLYFQKAYEASLEDEFFVDERDESYRYLTVSSNRNWLLLVGIDKESGKYQLTLHDLPEEDSWEATIPAVVDYLYLSPDGKFALFMERDAKDKQSCRFVAWQTSEEVFHRPNLKLPCVDKPAISDAGQILYMKKGHIGSYHVVEKKDVHPYLEKFPDKPFARLPAWARFHFSAKNVPFLTYGSAGNYKLYNLGNAALKLLTRAGSSPQMYFNHDEDSPGIIVGGAGSRRIFFYHPVEFSKVLYQLPVRRWREAAFYNKDHYYFIKKTLLNEFSNQKVKSLPFWASQIRSGSKKELYFLSPLGTAMAYRGRMPNATSKLIFDKGWDLHESR